MNEPGRTISDGQSIQTTISGGRWLLKNAMACSACEKTTLKSPSCVGAAGMGEFPRNPGLVTSSSTILPISSTNDCLLHPVQ